MQGDLGAWLDAASGTDEEFVDRIWRLAVRRAPEPDGRERALAKLGDGTLSRAGLLRELVSSEEFARVALLDDALAFAAGERARPRDGHGPWRPRLLHAPAAADERSLEIPWALARYDGERRLLDVGYAFAEPAYLAGLIALGATALTGVDLAEADVPGLEPAVADVRKLPFADSSFTSSTASRRSSTSAATTRCTRSTPRGRSRATRRRCGNCGACSRRTAA
jgi:hypothetical protein